jgi:hypothetical protein
MTDPTSRQRGRSKKRQDSNFEKKILWSKVRDWARHQDLLTDCQSQCDFDFDLEQFVSTCFQWRSNGPTAARNLFWFLGCQVWGMTWVLSFSLPVALFLCYVTALMSNVQVLSSYRIAGISRSRGSDHRRSRMENGSCSSWSYIATDGHSSSSSWCSAPFGACDQMLHFFEWQLTPWL